MIRKEYMETTNDRWVSLSPQTQVEIPHHMSEEAEVSSDRDTHASVHFIIPA